MHELVVLSDLHLGRGKNSETGRYHSLEAFFYDEDLYRFFQYLCDDAQRHGPPFKLVFNGDVFDLLRIEPEETTAGGPWRPRRFGPSLTPALAAHLVAEILAGHPRFVAAVAHVLKAGHEVIFLPGNHDIELQWPSVQAEVRRALTERVRTESGDLAAQAADALLRFESWFYYEPGRIWIEHGCQYDAESAFRYPLRGSLAAATDAAGQGEADLPLGSFIQRYLYNAFGPITFMVPSTRANARYFKWLLINRPRLLARVMASHAPFALQLLRRLSVHPRELMQQLRDAHQSELETLAQRSGLGDKLLTVDRLKDVKHDLVQTVRSLGWQLLRFTLISLMVAVLVVGLWFAGFLTINQLSVGFGPKALLFLALNFLLLAAAAMGMGYALLRAQPVPSSGPLSRAAREIAELLGTPIVTFGHTHDEAVWRLGTVAGHKAWYFNTGTWIAVFTHDELLPRERVQLTFLRVRGHEGELLHWSPGRGEPLPVILLDEDARGGALVHGGTPAA
jgi:UDP-2,3-diacylglucosamine pyrophosphatase LpxH